MYNQNLGGTRAVVIHAQFLPADTWERVMWGDPRNRVFGVIPKAVKVAHENGVSVLFFCSGIPNGDKTRQYSPHALEFTREHANELPSEWLGILDGAIFEVRRVLTHISGAVQALQMTCVSNLYVVSIPKHIPRVHQEFLTAMKELNCGEMTVFAIASDVDFPDATVDQVAIIEPSHRFDVPKWNTWRCAKAIISLMRTLIEPCFENFLRDLGDLLQRYGVDVTWLPREPDK